MILRDYGQELILNFHMRTLEPRKRWGKFFKGQDGSREQVGKTQQDLRLITFSSQDQGMGLLVKIHARIP